MKKRNFKRILLSVLVLVSICSTAIVSVSAAGKELTIYTEEYPPYNFKQGGKPSGIASDLLVEMFKNMNSYYNRSTIKVVPWARAYNAIQKQKNILVFSMTRTKEREKMFKWVGPIINSSNVLIAKKDTPISITGNPSYANYTYTAVREDIGEKIIKDKRVPAKNISLTPSGKTCARMLAGGRVDMWVYEETTAMWYLKNIGQNPSNFKVVKVLDKTQLYFAFSKDVPNSVIKDYQKALDKCKRDGTYKKIIRKYR